MRWPLPALLAWGVAWAVFLGMQGPAQVPAGVAFGVAAGLGALASIAGSTPWRRVFIAAGFPLSLLASGAAGGLPAWGWLVPLVLVLAVYPVKSWRDAPVFPTPRGALGGLDALLELPAGAAAVDAGCGLGDGLRELHAAFPSARLTGLEWSWPLTLACRLRCRLTGVPAQVRRADIWQADWSPFHLVYLFQRPESLPRALAKARAEMPAGGWLASLEFEAAGVRADATHACPDGRPVWLYRMPGPDRARADGPSGGPVARPRRPSRGPGARG